MKRAFIIVLDSFGIGALPDAALWNDQGSNTLAAIRRDPAFDCPVLESLGLFHIEGVGGASVSPRASYARMAEASAGKDTTIGHWEIAGHISPEPLPTYPDGFPAELITEFERLTGRGVLCNKPYSGTDVIRDYGREHIETGKLIVYTSADSVFQIAAHEDVIPVDELYRICETARRLLHGRHGVGRVIARPFTGEWPYTRTSRRHDFSIEVPGIDMLDILKEKGLEVLSVGKIVDIFAGRGITDYVRTSGNEDGCDRTEEMLRRDFRGLCFINLVDFDSSYGHRNDTAGYAAAMTAFDKRLKGFLPLLREDDILIITADHGCDPSTPSTDHSREYTPMLIFGEKIRAGVDLGTRSSFADIAATVLEYLDADPKLTAGESFLKKVMLPSCSPEKLMKKAAAAREKAYAPYSRFAVGAALLAGSGKIYTGCNIENAAFGPSVCAERTALFKAVSEGERVFKAIAVIGGPEGENGRFCTPCGVCRQALSEFCDDAMPVYLGSEEHTERYTLGQLLPESFGPAALR